MSHSTCSCSENCNCTKDNTGNVIGALLLGAAIGAALGLLLAPDTGANTRKRLAHKASDLVNDLIAKVKGNTGSDEAENFT